ncbi:50S ribosomal subunit [Grosmannia clavigera kw1407]|uniref:50S ribosomal subunit n=1 Tax=Grosmannia clavigera (strain kw1407 / UAMH 11150) TaxID=655863 RepID=F0XRF6_GROCL|nr:50S ribosomal subunit [Grosmannia clavigera kw1407]EFW99776.1 50S ribosomal subunit [Grosmannia clavigera kw1407]
MTSIRGLVRTTRPARPSRIVARPQAAPCLFRCASNQAALPAEPAFADLEKDSSFLTPQLPADVKIPSPRDRALQRKSRLPGGRYQFHPPKYDRGPLHPVQAPPSSDPVARDFQPGPFNLPRLKETFHSTVAADLMTLAYTHTPPGTGKEPTPDRLRAWDGSSPYHKNRSRRAPRGEPVLRPLERPISFNNIPTVRSVTLAAFVPLAVKEKDRLVVARSVIQSITGVVPEVTTVKHNVAQWGIIKGQQAGLKVTVHGNAAYEFLDKCIHLVFPRIKDWKGIKGSTGDSVGNLAWGFRPEDVALFPEIEVNYSMYPGKMLPGFRVFVETSAKSDRHARLLLQAFGIPFYGEMRD